MQTYFLTLTFSSAVYCIAYLCIFAPFFGLNTSFVLSSLFIFPTCSSPSQTPVRTFLEHSGHQQYCLRKVILAAVVVLPLKWNTLHSTNRSVSMAWVLWESGSTGTIDAVSAATSRNSWMTSTATGRELIDVKDILIELIGLQTSGSIYTCTDILKNSALRLHTNGKFASENDSFYKLWPDWRFWKTLCK